MVKTTKVVTNPVKGKAVTPKVRENVYVINSKTGLLSLLKDLRNNNA